MAGPTILQPISINSWGRLALARIFRLTDEFFRSQFVSLRFSSLLSFSLVDECPIAVKAFIRSQHFDQTMQLYLKVCQYQHNVRLGHRGNEYSATRGFRQYEQSSTQYLCPADTELYTTASWHDSSACTIAPSRPQSTTGATTIGPPTSKWPTVWRPRCGRPVHD